MNSFRLLFLFVCSSILFVACGGGASTDKTTISIDLNDAVVQQILTIRSKRDADGKANTEALKTYLAVENPNHRYIAALSLASIQDSMAITVLTDALKDPYEEVRIAAAFALGQTRNPAAIKGLLEAFMVDSVRAVQATILEAVGRCGTADQLKNMCVSAPYPMQDTQLLVGLATGLYRFALQKKIQPEGTARIVNEFIAHSAMPAEARFVAANYLARVPNLDLKQFETVLINAIKEEKNVDTKMFLVLGLAKVKTIPAFKVLAELYNQEEDYRVRCNILRGMQHFSYDSTRQLMTKALYDTSIHVRVTAVDYLHNFGNARDAIQYYQWSENYPHWQVKAKLIGAALHHMEPYKGASKAFISTKTIDQLRNSDNVYEKAELLLALGNYSWNYKYIIETMFPTADSIKLSPILFSYGATALLSIYENPNMKPELGLMYQKVKDDMHIAFRRIVETGDPGATSIIAEAIAKPELNFKQVFPDYSFLRAAQNKLPLPRDIETYIYLQKAIDYLSDTKTDLSNKGKSNFVEIDWPVLITLGNKPKVKIKTSKGQMIMELLPKEAPATVMQFVQLVKAGYYNNKTFHRVVPNFVAQGGCSRGDGWGGFDVTVVSEFGFTRYRDAGMVGMASAGKDTESTQFFITHAPTIHLDGNYTIFGKITEGLDILHLIEVGDLIEKIEIIP